MQFRGISSASSIAAYRKRDAAGTLLVDVASSDAGHDDAKFGADVEKATHNAASSSSRPPKDKGYFFNRYELVSFRFQTSEVIPLSIAQIRAQ